MPSTHLPFEGSFFFFFFSFCWFDAEVGGIVLVTGDTLGSEISEERWEKGEVADVYFFSCYKTLIILFQLKAWQGLPWWRSGWESACQCKETRVRALVWEDPTCRGATRPMSHNYWACVSGACALRQEGPRQWEARAPRWRVAPTRCN